MLGKKLLLKILVFSSFCIILLISFFPRGGFLRDALLDLRRISANKQRSIGDQRSEESINAVEFVSHLTIQDDRTLLEPTRNVTKFWIINEREDYAPRGSKSSRVVALPFSDVTRSKSNEVINVYPSSSGNFSMYGDGNCPGNKHRSVLIKIFKKWLEIAKHEGIEYFLTCGSLLGSFRNGELIPGDTDMDILVNRSVFPKIKKYHSKRKFSGFEDFISVFVNKDFYLPYSKRRRFTCRGKMVPAYRDHCSFQEPLGRLITENHHLDIYDYQQNGESLWDPSEGGRAFHTNEVFPLRTCYFMSLKTKCPNKPKEFLRKFYGTDLRPIKVCKNGNWVERVT